MCVCVCMCGEVEFSGRCFREGRESVLIITQVVSGTGEVCLVLSKIDHLNGSALAALPNAIKDGQSVVWVAIHLAELSNLINDFWLIIHESSSMPQSG